MAGSKLFGHIEAARVDTADVVIKGLADMEPCLKVKIAGDGNDDYFNALLESQRRGRRGRMPRVTAAVSKRFRRQNRALVAEHCVVGWDQSTVIDVQGNAVPFTKENCLDLVNALPDEIFDDFYDEISDPATFTARSDPEDVEAQAGNLQTG